MQDAVVERVHHAGEDRDDRRDHAESRGRGGRTSSCPAALLAALALVDRDGRRQHRCAPWCRRRGCARRARRAARTRASSAPASRPGARRRRCGRSDRKNANHRNTAIRPSPSSTPYARPQSRERDARAVRDRPQRRHVTRGGGDRPEHQHRIQRQRERARHVEDEPVIDGADQRHQRPPTAACVRTVPVTSAVRIAHSSRCENVAAATKPNSTSSESRKPIATAAGHDADEDRPQRVADDGRAVPAEGRLEQGADRRRLTLDGGVGCDHARSVAHAPAGRRGPATSPRTRRRLRRAPPAPARRAPAGRSRRASARAP